VTLAEVVVQGNFGPLQDPQEISTTFAHPLEHGVDAGKACVLPA
jgi:hypothetical protein